MSQPLDPKGAGASRTAGTSKSETESGLERLRNLFGGGGGRAGGPGPAPPDQDEEDDGMLRMSFLEHLEELRSRIIRIIVGMFVALCVSFTFVDNQPSPGESYYYVRAIQVDDQMAWSSPIWIAR